MNNPSGMSQAEVIALLATGQAGGRTRRYRRSSEARARDNAKKVSRAERRAKNRAARRARARNRR